jgi:hypothetical protein
MVNYSGFAAAKRDQLYGALLRQLSDLQTFTVVAIEDVHWANERQRWIS